MSLLSIFREGSLIVMFKVAIMGEYNVTKLKVELNTAYYQHRAELQYNLKEEFTQFSGKCNKTKRKKHRFFLLDMHDDFVRCADRIFELDNEMDTDDFDSILRNKKNNILFWFYHIYLWYLNKKFSK